MVEKIVIGKDWKDLKKFGDKGTAYIGKHVVGKGEESHLTNPMQMDLTRPHIVLVCGKRGTGKCVEENTLVALDDGSVIPIKDLENNTRKVHMLDKNLKISTTKNSNFFKRRVNKLFHIKLRSGKEIKLTHEHPLLTIKGWVPVEHLKIGSRIAVPRKIPSFGNNEMEKYKIKLLAYLIAEGHIKRNLVRFTNMDKKIIKDFKESVEEFDENLKMEEHIGDSYGVSQKRKTMDLSLAVRDRNGMFCKGSITKPLRNSLVLWLNDIGIYDKNSLEKFVPDEILRLPKDQLALFLNRLFSCDGSIYKHRTGNSYTWELSYSTSSERLAHQVQHLLLRFGILSKLRKKKIKLKGKNFDSYELAIGTDNVLNFINEIGFYGAKTERQRVFLREIPKPRNPNIDTIPKEIWDIYRPLNWAMVGRAFNYSIPKGLRTSIGYAPSRQKLMQIAEVDQNTAIYMIATSEIFWDEIIYMEELEGVFNVCDITIPELHNFIANDIIIHNSYSAGVVAEEIYRLPDDIRSNLSVLMIDTMGIYWSMKLPNEKDIDLLKEWGLKPQGLAKAKIFVPKGYVKEYKEAGITIDSPFTLSVGELTPEDWITTFGFSMIDEYGITIERIVEGLKERRGSKYSITDIISGIRSDKTTEKKVKDALVNRFLAAKEWGLFEKEGTGVEDLLKPGTVSILDVSHYMRVSESWSIRAMLVALLSRKIFAQRLKARKAEEYGQVTGQAKKTMPMVWVMIDEAHQFIPNGGSTAATGPLLTLIKEGREPGISLLMITQRPNKLHEDALSQSDLVISHRLTSKADIEALRSIMQTYMLEDIQDYLNDLPRTKGSAIILDDNSERIYQAQIRPRFSWHAGGSPIIIKEKSLIGEEKTQKEKPKTNL